MKDWTKLSLTPDQQDAFAQGFENALRLMFAGMKEQAPTTVFRLPEDADALYEMLMHRLTAQVAQERLASEGTHWGITKAQA